MSRTSALGCWWTNLEKEGNRLYVSVMSSMMIPDQGSRHYSTDDDSTARRGCTAVAGPKCGFVLKSDFTGCKSQEGIQYSTRKAPANDGGGVISGAVVAFSRWKHKGGQRLLESSGYRHRI